MSGNRISVSSLSMRISMVPADTISEVIIRACRTAYAALQQFAGSLGRGDYGRTA